MRSTFNFDWITPQLAVGGRWPLEAAEHLARRERIRAVVDVRVEARDDEATLRRHGVDFLHLPTQDVCAIAQPMIDDGVAWIGERLDRDERVLVHCEHGIGRSALLALCVQVARGAEPLEALARTKASRPVVSPSPEQLEAFRAWIARHAERTGRVLAPPPFDALASIAYSHLRAS